MKGVLKHMKTCQVGRSCKSPHCAVSNRIIKHWNKCERQSCRLCAPVKRLVNQSLGGTSIVLRLAEEATSSGPVPFGMVSSK